MFILSFIWIISFLWKVLKYIIAARDDETMACVLSVQLKCLMKRPEKCKGR